MRPIVNLVELRVGGEMRWAVAGLVTGVVLALTPLQLLSCGGPFLLAGVVWLLSRVAHRPLRTAHVCFVAIVGGLLVSAALSPKGADNRVKISSPTLTLRQLADELELRGDATDERITLPSAEPTWSEVKTAIAQQSSQTLRLRQCATMASLLTGPTVLGGYLEPAQ